MLNEEEVQRELGSSMEEGEREDKTQEERTKVTGTNTSKPELPRDCVERTETGKWKHRKG